MAGNECNIWRLSGNTKKAIASYVIKGNWILEMETLVSYYYKIDASKLTDIELGVKFNGLIWIWKNNLVNGNA